MKSIKFILGILGILSMNSCESNKEVNNDLEQIKFKIYDTADLPINLESTDIIECIGVDNKNNVWMGCRPLIKFNGQLWETYGQEVFGERNYCGNDIDFDSKGNIWFGTFNGLFKYNGKSWESFFYIKEHPFHTSISNVHCDKDNNIWFAKGSDLVCYNGNDWITFEYQKKFPGIQIQSITSDINGNVYIGCFDALYKYSGNEFVKYYFSKENEDMNIRDLDFDKIGNLWISCRSNLLILKDNKLIEIDASSIKNPQYDDHNWNVSSIAVNNQNNDIAIGTWNTGIAFYKNQNFSFFRGKEFGIDSTHFQINELAFDKNNNLWIVTRFGKIIVYNENGLKF